MSSDNEQTPEKEKASRGRPRTSFNNDDCYALIEVIKNWLQKRDHKRIRNYFNITGDFLSDEYHSQLIELENELDRFKPYLYNELESINQWVSEKLSNDGRLRLQRNLSDRRRRCGRQRKIKSNTESRKTMVTVQVQHHVRERLKNAVLSEGAESIDALISRLLRDHGY